MTARKRQVQRFNFTMPKIEALEPLEKKRYDAWDDEEPKLACTVTKKGTKTFYWVKKVNRKTERVRIGVFPETTVDDARKAVRQYSGELVIKSKNPAETKRLIKGEASLGELWVSYLEYAETEKRSWRNDKWQYEKHLSGWANRRLSGITGPQVETLKRSIKKNHGPVAANRALALLSIMFSFANKNGAGAGNPTIGVERYPEEPRTRFLKNAELGRFLRTLADDENQSCADVIRLLLFTGARKSNVMAMRWEDLNLSDAVWTIPRGSAKAGKTIHIPLVPEAIEVIRRHEGKDGTFVFSTAPGQHRKSIRWVWDRVCAAANVSDLTPHDLRRTLASWMGAGKSPKEVVGAALGHSVSKKDQTMVYLQLQLDGVRAAILDAVGRMTATAVEDDATGKVIRFPGVANGD